MFHQLRGQNDNNDDAFVMKERGKQEVVETLAATRRRNVVDEIGDFGISQMGDDVLLIHLGEGCAQTARREQYDVGILGGMRPLCNAQLLADAGRTQDFILAGITTFVTLG